MELGSQQLGWVYIGYVPSHAFGCNPVTGCTVTDACNLRQTLDVLTCAKSDARNGLLVAFDDAANLTDGYDQNRAHQQKTE